MNLIDQEKNIMGLSIQLQGMTFKMLAMLIVLVCTVTSSGYAEDVKNLEPILENTSDVYKMKMLALKAASEPVPEVIAAIKAEEQAFIVLQKAIQTGNSNLIEASENAHHAAEISAVTIMAAFSGVMQTDVSQMRGKGREWGEIAEELGVHPGALGLSNVKANASQYKSDMMPETSRDLKSGRTNMQGGSSGNISSSYSMGNNHTEAEHSDSNPMRGSSHTGMDHGNNDDSTMGGRHGDGMGGDSGDGSSGGHGGEMGGGPGDGSSGGHGGGMGGGPGDGSGGGHGGGMGGGHM